MKKFLLPLLLCTVPVMFSLQGCLKDTYTKTFTYTYYQPIYQSKDVVRLNVKSNTPQKVERPGKIYIRGNTIFLNEIAGSRPDIGKVELIAREGNPGAIALYQSVGFRIEGRLEMRIKTPEGIYEADIPMGWQNPNFEF